MIKTDLVQSIIKKKKNNIKTIFLIKTTETDCLLSKVLLDLTQAKTK